MEQVPSKHLKVVSTLSFGWCDVATWDNFKSTLKQRCVFQRWNLQRLKARIHCEIFLSDYSWNSLMYISLHLVWFHEIHIKYVKRKSPRLRKKELKRSLRPATLLKKILWRSSFPENFAKFLKTPFLRNTSGRLLLQDRKEKRLFLRKQGNSTKERHIIPGRYVNLYHNTVSNFARLHGVCPPDYNPEHVNIPRKKANF